VFSGSDTIGGLTLTSTNQNIPINFEHKKTSGMTHAANSEQVTVGVSGTYVISGYVSLLTIDGANNSGTAQLFRNSGAGYTGITGTLVNMSIDQNNSDDRSTGTFSIILDVNANDQFKLQTRLAVDNGGGGGSVVQTTPGSGLTIHSIGIGPQGVQGVQGPTGPSGGPQGPTGPPGTITENSVSLLLVTMPTTTTTYTTIGVNGVGLTGLTGGFTGMFIVPGVTGKYYASFSASAQTSVNNVEWDYALFKNSSIIQHSQRTIERDDANERSALHTQAVITLDSLSDSISAKTIRIGGASTLVFEGTSLTILKLS
jgi:hypothetical protein